MKLTQNLIPLREYCCRHEWPRLPQWHHWIYAKNTRYLIDLNAFQKCIEIIALEETPVKKTWRSDAEI